LSTEIPHHIWGKHLTVYPHLVELKDAKDINK
jgi:hypothetical protein